MKQRISPETELLVGIFNFIKNIVTVALGVVLGAYLLLQIAEYRAKEAVKRFQQEMRQVAPHSPQPGAQLPHRKGD